MHVLRNRDYRKELEQPASDGGLSIFNTKKVRMQVLFLFPSPYKDTRICGGADRFPRGRI
jgi:hypothetical protein